MQFTLQSLLLSAVVIWSSLAAFGPWGIAVAASVVAVSACIRTAGSAEQAVARIGCLFLVVLPLPLLVTLFWPASGAARARPYRPCCPNNLKRICLGLLNYESANGRFPPPYTTDADGKPMHSWRALILPYMEAGETLSQKYNFNEPWNGPNNRKLASRVPVQYVCPDHAKGARSEMTDYVAVVGPNTVWRTSKPTPIGAVTDGASNTIILVRVANSGIHWMEPRDLSLEEACQALDRKGKNGDSGPRLTGDPCSCYEGDQAAVALGDGSVHLLSPDLSPEDLKALLSIDGGEPVGAEQFDSFKVRRRPWRKLNRQLAKLTWANCIAMAALLVSTGLLLFRPRRRAKEPIAEDANSPETRN